MTGLRAEIAALNRRTLLGVAALIGIVGGWLALAPLDGAVVASGIVAVESNVKRVQHQAGGIVSEILVQEGDRVAAGDLLFRLDPTQVHATASVLDTQWVALRAREARLLAERDGATEVVTPPGLAALTDDAGSTQALIGERSLFASRLAARSREQAQLEQRLTQVAAESKAMRELARARNREAELLAQELDGVQQLHASGHMPIQRLVALQRDMTRLESERLQFAADSDRLMGRAGEVELEILRRHSEHQTEVVDALRAVQVEIAGLEERRTAAADNSRRLDVRAPHAGVVLDSQLDTVGGVLAAGATAMLIVPDGDPLVVEARVPPRDIDQVLIGAPAAVKLLAGNTRRASDLAGRVLNVSADLVRDPASVADGYFLVRISLDRQEVLRRAGFDPHAGMSAEAFIATGERTALSYLLQPVRDQLDRALRER